MSQTRCETQHTSQRDTQIGRYTTAGGISVIRTEETLPAQGRDAIDSLIGALDTRRGALYTSTTEIPGRYELWDRGFVNPPLVIEARGRCVTIRALNARGALVLPCLLRAVTATPGCSAEMPAGAAAREIRIEVDPPTGSFAEEERSRQPSVFAALRSVISLFRYDADSQLGLYGAFGYDLAFQFEPIPLSLPRAPEHRDLVLYLPDEILAIDHRRERAVRIRYDFAVGGASTAGLPRSGEATPFRPAELLRGSDHEPGEFAQVVRRARRAFARGDLFEVVPSQVFSQGARARPSEVFRRLRARNPSPYGFLINLGCEEYLVGASPEMYVRIGRRRGPNDNDARQRVETCPIAGTIARGRDALEDAVQIERLLTSRKDECELTMCTDVDRNDKSRVCEPGTVRVVGRRQIELYSRLIHTVDHVEGTLSRGRDALDAFLAHAWAVTVTGAPKRAAMRFIEEHELSPRRWYGGAVGSFGFDGSCNTGLTLRTIHIESGVASVRAGATLLYDSDPDAEEAETGLKAAALLDALERPDGCTTTSEGGIPGEKRARQRTPREDRPGLGKRVLIVDAQDSFVHTLASYFRETGAKVKTLRAGFPPDDLPRYEPDLVVLSPGPGRPDDFGLGRVLEAAVALELPIFGVCLGLQAIAEFFGGELGVLPEPVHGKASEVRVSGEKGGRLFRGLPSVFQAGRYHSLIALPDSLPPELIVTATDASGVVMALEHAHLPIAAVQFHPESILTLQGDVGWKLVHNLVSGLPVRPRERVSRAVLD